MVPPIDLKKRMEENPRFAKSLRSRCFETLPQEKVDEIISMMGEVMSMHKLNRKVALLATIQYNMAIGETLSAGQVADRMNSIMRKNNWVESRHIGNLMVLMVKWGFVTRSRPSKTKKFEYTRVK